MPLCWEVSFHKQRRNVTPESVEANSTLYFCRPIIGYISVADPEFLRGGGANPAGGHQHTILPGACPKCRSATALGTIFLS